MNRDFSTDASFLQNRANHYRQLAERQTDKNLAERYHHLAGVFERQAQGSDDDQPQKTAVATRGITIGPTSVLRAGDKTAHKA